MQSILNNFYDFDADYEPIPRSPILRLKERTSLMTKLMQKEPVEEIKPICEESVTKHSKLIFKRVPNCRDQKKEILEFMNR